MNLVGLLKGADYKMSYVSTSSRIRVVNGAREAEALVLKEVSQWVEEARRYPSLLSDPLRILVPSRSLREHLALLLVRKLRPGLAGVRIQTLHSLAKEILEKQEKRLPGGASLVELLIRRHGSLEPQLRAQLEHLRDGMGALVGSVVDFLEAGFEEAHLEALQECLSVEPEHAAAQRTMAILRVSCAVLKDMRRVGIGLNSRLLVLAKEELEAKAPGSLGEGPLLIHGFAELTGVGLDFLETLFKLKPCQLILDHPPWPGRWNEKDPGHVFTSRLLERLTRNASLSQEPKAEFTPPELMLFEAPGVKAECRQVALLIQGLLRGGVRPEEIGVVARRLEPYAAAIRSQFLELGIPFSGVSAKGPQDPVSRNLKALEALLLDREQCKVELWLELLEGGASQRPSKHELLTACRCLGAVRLKDVACLDLERITKRWPRGYPLPLRIGLEDEEEQTCLGKRIPLEELEALKNRACQLLDRLSSWIHSQSPIKEQAHWLESLVSECLGWCGSGPWISSLRDLLQELPRDAASRFPVSGEEFLLILGQSLKRSGSPRLGGRGGGVQVLDVMEARGRTFEHLFLMGMNREVFPRAIQEDPLVPDSLRMRLLGLLPDLPIKERGFEEERYLFAQLISSSPKVILSWQSTDEQGKKKSLSPLVERLRLEAGLEASSVNFSLWQECLWPGLGPSPHPPKEHALRAALEGRRGVLEPLFALALRDSYPKTLIWDPRETARARMRVLEEMDPDLATSQGRRKAALPGPYLGLAGPACKPGDPRLNELYVTTLENLALCPWQTLLRRILRVERPQDPLEALPEMTKVQLGKLVHRVLEAVVQEPRGKAASRDLSQCIPQEAIEVCWPSQPGKLEQLALALADELLQDEGIGLRGIGRALAVRALPYLHKAKEVDWPGEESQVFVLASEVKGFIRLGKGQRRALFFRADRADLSQEGILITDYKVGKSISEAAKEETRRKKFLQELASGQRLQVAAYACLDAQGLKAKGRYLFLKPELPEQTRQFIVSEKDEDFLEEFRRVARLLMGAWDLGIFFPRLVSPDGKKEPEQCRYCEVSLACVRGDSTQRARLIRWAQKAREKPSSHKWEELFLKLWELPLAGKSRTREGEGS